MRFSQALSFGLGTVLCIVGTLLFLVMFTFIGVDLTMGQAARLMGLFVVFVLLPLTLTFFAMITERIWVSRACSLGLSLMTCWWVGIVIYG